MNISKEYIISRFCIKIIDKVITQMQIIKTQRNSIEKDFIFIKSKILALKTSFYHTNNPLSVLHTTTN